MIHASLMSVEWVSNFNTSNRAYVRNDDRQPSFAHPNKKRANESHVYHITCFITVRWRDEGEEGLKNRRKYIEAARTKYKMYLR